MSKVTRRDAVRGSLSAIAATTLAAGAPVKTGWERKPIPGKAGIQFASMLSPNQASACKLSKQLGVNYAIVGVSGALSKVHRSEYVSTLTKIKSEFSDHGLIISGVESHPVPAEKIKLGIDGRDEEIENYKAAIDALGRVGIPVLCYNFMAGLGWYRTRMDQKGRGGALVTEFDYDAGEALGPTQFGEVSEEKMWDNMQYFLHAVMPVAEKSGVQMALHPDDPPLPKVRGIARIVTSARNYRRIMDIAPSPVNGVTYCQANFVAMGEDIEAVAKEFMRDRKIFFVHFRDIAGKGKHFVETFHDEGQTDMARMLRVYHEGGFSGPMRSDHAPTMEGEANDHPGYEVRGMIFAIGYMKGLMQGMNLPYA